MNKKYIIAALFFVLISLISFKGIAKYQAVSYRDFDRLEGSKTAFFKKLSIKDKEELAFFKKRYLAGYDLLRKDKHQGSIPKAIHYIWVGPKPFPEKSLPLVESWMARHKEWRVFFWTDDALRALPHDSMIRRDIKELSDHPCYPLIDKTDNYGERSDIIRYILLAREGGVYIDHDIECFSSFDPLAACYDFFAGLEVPHKNEGIDSRVFPCNALIGVKPSHPVMDRTLQLLHERWHEVERSFTHNDAQSQVLKVLHRTFHSFTLAVKEEYQKVNSRDIVFPASFFYPEPIATERQISCLKKKGLTMASHKCQGEWKPKGDLVATQDEVNQLKKEKQKYLKKYKKSRALLYASSLLSSICMYLIIKKKGKKRAHAP